MESTSDQSPSFLIVKADRLYAESLRHTLLGCFPRARMILAHDIAGGFAALAQNRFDVIITGVGSALKGDALDLLAACLAESKRSMKALVVSTHLEERILVALRVLGVTGLFDTAHEEPANFAGAVRSVAAGGYYWTDGARQRLAATATSTFSPFRVLTAAEQFILSIVGDGCDDEVAAAKLGLSTATIATVRRQLHRKLGVQHRGALMRVAVLNGFVRFTGEGVVRPGFALLQAAYSARRKRRPPIVAA